MRFGVLGLLFLWVSAVLAQDRTEWNKPQKPFKIYGNSYYVGTRGLSSVLLASSAGHVLLDGALPESVPQIVANIKSLGFRVEDVKLILNSHVHFDHAGGIAELQKLSGARVAASKWSAGVLRKGGVARDDPQYGAIDPIVSVAKVDTFKDRETLSAGAITVTAHETPGHTPGGTSWTWQSCENSRCLNMVYSDSLTPASADGFLFTKAKDALDGFATSIRFLNGTPCDILITTHPEVSRLWQRLERRDAEPDALISRNACRELADRARRQLDQRLASERRQ